MDLFTVLLVASSSALILGGIIGLIIGRASNSPEERQKLQKELDSTQRELNSYKEEVSDHFARTAELVNNLTESYREVHQHLAQSADSLCDSDKLTHRLEQPMPNNALEQNETKSDQTTKQTDDSKDADQLEPPKDYAPKTDPDAEGTLSENFGLQSDNDETLQHDPSKTADHVKN